MATKLTKPVVREVVLKDKNGVAGPVNVTLTASGLQLQAKGKQRKLTFSFDDLHAGLTLPPNAPAKFTGNPLGWLVEDAAEPSKPKAPKAKKADAPATDAPVAEPAPEAPVADAPPAV